MQKGINSLIEIFAATDLVEQRNGLSYITVEKAKATAAVTHMKAMEGYSVLSLISVVDWIEDNQFQITYLLSNPDEISEVGIRVFIDREEATMESMHHLWPNVATWQRENREMYGIDFPGSPRVNEPWILEGWEEMPPYRRDFDTKQYAEDTFFPREGRKSHDPATYMREQLDPKDPQLYTKKRNGRENS